MAGQVGDVLMQDEILEALPADKVQFTMNMAHHVLEGLIHNHEVERAIFLFRDLRARSLNPRVRTFNLMIAMCIENREPEEAFNILIACNDKYGKGSIDKRYWWQVLEACAREGFVSLLEN